MMLQPSQSKRNSSNKLNDDKSDVHRIFDLNDPLIVQLSQKPKNRTELASDYGVSVKVLNRWFQEKDLNIPQGLICPCDLSLIYSTLGLPCAINIKEL